MFSKMNKSGFLAMFMLLFFVASLVISSGNAAALSGSDFKAGDIIDDAIFSNNSSMSAQQIQYFLNSKVPVCDTNGSQIYSGSQTRAQYGASKGYPAPYTCLKSYSQDTPSMGGETGLCNPLAGGVKVAAQIIFDVSQACGINPQVLLVLLQKEQSLVTDDWPWPSEYQNATGFGCPDTAPCDPTYGGFFYQVYYAARQFKVYAKNPTVFNYRANRNNSILYNPNSACGSSNVFIQNQSTADLYIYTPYQPNPAALNNLYGTGDSCSSYGNRNFWRMFNDWFGTTNGTSLVQGSNQTVYLVNGSTKYGIPSTEMMGNYRLRSTIITPSSDSYLNSLTDGGVLGTLFTVEGDPTVYLADNGVKYGIPSASLCTDWALNCSTGVKTISYNVANAMPSAGVLQQIMQNNFVIYKMQGGVRHPYLSQAALAADGYSGVPASIIWSGYNLTSALGSPIIENSVLVKFGANPTIYYYVNGHFYGIASGTIFSNWFPGGGVYYDNVSQYATSPPTSSGLVPSMIQTGSAKTYIIDRGRKIDVSARSSDWPAGTVNADLDALANSFPTLATINASNTFRTPVGAIYTVRGGQRNVIASMNDFYALGYSLDNAVPLNEDTISVIPFGSFEVGEGSVFKVVGSSAIYLKGPGSSVYNLQTISQLGQFQLTREDPVLPVAQLSLYSAPQPLSSFIGTDGSATAQYMLDADTRLWNFGSTQASQWGISSPTLTNMSSTGATMSGLQKTSSSLPQFALYNGTVYYGSGGVKHPIATYNSYLQLGGNASNTFNATKDFIDAAPTGSIM